MTPVRVSEAVREWLGWCPVAAASRQETRWQGAAVPQEKAGEPGPVAGRAVLFSHLTWVFVGLSWIVALAALPHLPAIIPVHWNLFGEADAFTGRLPGTFGL